MSTVPDHLQTNDAIEMELSDIIHVFRVRDMWQLITCHNACEINDAHIYCGRVGFYIAYASKIYVIGFMYATCIFLTSNKVMVMWKQFKKIFCILNKLYYLYYLFKFYWLKQKNNFLKQNNAFSNLLEEDVFPTSNQSRSIEPSIDTLRNILSCYK